MKGLFCLFRVFNWLILILFVCYIPVVSSAQTDCYLINECSQFRRDPSSPSPGAQIKINPSAVPTEKGYGLETIYFTQEADFSLVRGNGRMGASLSPSNSEDTFFGAPGLETSEDLQERKSDRLKYPTQKFTLATAFNLKEKKGSGLRRYSFKVGLMGKYNKLTHRITAGAGLNAVWGAVSAGYSIYGDETQLEYSPYFTEDFRYQVQTYNIGIHLSSLILNYSNLRMRMSDVDEDLARIHLYTASLTAGKFIFTASKRVEQSQLPTYNYETEQVEYKENKEEYFGGIQYALSKNLMAGFLYNYYLLREAAVTATLYF